MPFPFLPAGAVLAATVLVAALSVFGLVLRAMDRAIVGQAVCGSGPRRIRRSRSASGRATAYRPISG